MRYEVRVNGHDGSVERFFISRDVRPRKGDVIEQMTLPYRVLRVLPGTGEVDAVLEAEGPSQTATAADVLAEG
jgi:hypothetical protein